jgi:hypothetical protein
MQARRRCPLARPGNAFAEEERAGPRHRLGTRWAGLSETRPTMSHCESFRG